MVRWISPYFSVRELNRYLKRQRCSPQPGMRRAVKSRSGFQCWLYEQYEWTLHSVTQDREEAVAWWLGDPWLPEQQFGYLDEPRSQAESGSLESAGAAAEGILVAEHRSGTAESGSQEWTLPRWEAAAANLAAAMAARTGIRPLAVGPESIGPAAGDYQRLLRDEMAGEIAWTPGRHGGRPRVRCSVRADLPNPLRCVVLAEAIVLLSRRPAADARIAISDPPPGIAAEAASLLNEFGLPKQALYLLLR
jgi:hypothetical protein